ncbi:hypothetical protein ACS0TY_015472 [Phlomoides rotata]
MDNDEKTIPVDKAYAIYWEQEVLRVDKGALGSNAGVGKQLKLIQEILREDQNETSLYFLNMGKISPWATSKLGSEGNYRYCVYDSDIATGYGVATSKLDSEGNYRYCVYDSDIATGYGHFYYSW